jgi:hypothetical protein
VKACLSFLRAPIYAYTILTFNNSSAPLAPYEGKTSLKPEELSENLLIKEH